MTECVRGCGNCCEEIPVDVDRLRARRVAGELFGDFDTRHDVPFILQYWQPHPDLKGVSTCTRFDSVNRECTAHDERPRVCSGYPWYGDTPTPGTLPPKGCVFAGDVPIAVQLGATRCR